MTHLLIVILDDLKCLPNLLLAWRNAGVPGATILESVGAYRAHTWLNRVGLGALERLFEAEEIRRRTLLAAIEDEGLLARAVAEAERVVGGFERPNSGILLVLPVAEARGLRKERPTGPEAEKAPPHLVCAGWQEMRVEEVARAAGLEPVTVPPDAPLDEVARALAARPGVRVACVVTEEGRLTGLLDIHTIADNLLFYILPEELLREVTDLERVAEFAARIRIHTAADGMQRPVWVKETDTLKQALMLMHEHRLSGLPVVDEAYQVVGYVDLLGLLTHCLAQRNAETKEAR
ncbi:MAG: CBS domain-containing protein [Anaerolineae bacterium]|nr:CBS domain-containing protein [Anaerolineae bacterium]